MRWLYLILLAVAGCSAPSNDKLIIAVASNTQYALEEIMQVFTDKTGISCNLVVSSSGKLTAQIKEGAPFDLLVSADMKYPEELYLSGITTDKPMIYAYGKLVLWSASDQFQPTLNDLTNSMVRHVAIANPNTAPYGNAALELLENNGMTDTVRDKLVYGESLSQTNQFILSGAAEIGFTAKSVVLSKSMKEKGRWLELDQDEYTPLAQGVVIIENEKVELSQQFYNFLLSPEGQNILQKYGYDGSSPATYYLSP
jgi:molybdate transport system substrate-binding protein